MIQQIDNLIVSIVISAYNEEKYLPGLIEDLKRQTYNKEDIEILFINAMSTDKTTDIIQRFISEDTEFRSIRLYDNPKKNQASGFNLGIKNSNGDLILKIDAHSKVTENFVRNNVELINQGEYICGGPRPTIVKAKGSGQKLYISLKKICLEVASQIIEIVLKTDMFLQFFMVCTVEKFLRKLV